MKIFLFRANNYFSSRVRKYVEFYDENKIDYQIVGWDRELKEISYPHYRFFKYKAGVAVGGIIAIKNHIKWMCYVYKYLKSNKDVTTIHACDLNSAFPAALFKILYNKKVQLIFDVCDWFSDNFSNKPFLSNTLSLLEKFTCNHSNEIIICEKERRAQIKFPLKKDPLVMPNIPKVDNPNFCFDDKYRFDNNNVTIAYFGGFSKSRYLLELLDIVEKIPINLLIGGFGDSEIEDKCTFLSKLPNVRYFGKMEMLDGLQMSYNSDIIFAAYSTINKNHIYAAPNKYYESMLLGKPIISNKGTILAEKIEHQNIGFTFEENYKSLFNLLSSLKKEDFKLKSEKTKELWKNVYSTYIQDFFNNEYIKIIK